MQEGRNVLPGIASDELRTRYASFANFANIVFCLRKELNSEIINFFMLNVDQKYYKNFERGLNF